MIIYLSNGIDWPRQIPSLMALFPAHAAPLDVSASRLNQRRDSASLKAREIVKA
jgi:hypothetical protein